MPQQRQTSFILFFSSSFLLFNVGSFHLFILQSAPRSAKGLPGLQSAVLFQVKGEVRAIAEHMSHASVINYIVSLNLAKEEKKGNIFDLKLDAFLELTKSIPVCALVLLVLFYTGCVAQMEFSDAKKVFA